MWAREHCRISQPPFLAECCKRRLNQGSFCFDVLFVVRFSWVVFSLAVFLICLLFCIFQREQTWMVLYSLIVLTRHQVSTHSLACDFDSFRTDEAEQCQVPIFVKSQSCHCTAGANTWTSRESVVLGSDTQTCLGTHHKAVLPPAAAASRAWC